MLCTTFVKQRFVFFHTWKFFEDRSSEGFFNIPITRTIYPQIFFYFFTPPNLGINESFYPFTPRDMLC